MIETIFHLVMTVWVAANGALFLWLTVRAVAAFRSAVSRTVRLLAVIVALVGATFTVGSTQRIALQLIEGGVLPVSWRSFFLTWWQLALTALGTVVAVLVHLRIRRALERLDRGERVVAVLTDRVAVAPAVSEWGLTARELEVLEAIGEGVRSDQDLSEALYISPSTAATHVRNILRKAGLNNRNDLMFIVRGEDR